MGYNLLIDSVYLYHIYNTNTIFDTMRAITPCDTTGSIKDIPIETSGLSWRCKSRLILILYR